MHHVAYRTNDLDGELARLKSEGVRLIDETPRTGTHGWRIAFLLSGVTDPQEELVRPALEGTRNVLDSVNRADSVRRVVLTSSVVAIYGDARELLDVPGRVFTDDHWNTTSSVDHQPYPYSKTVAEREAWRYQQEQDRWDLVTIHPGLVLGPSLTTASESASLSTMKQFTDGTLLAGAPALTVGVVEMACSMPTIAW